MTGVWLKDTAAVLVCSDGSDLASGLLLLDAVRYRRPLWGCCQDTSDCSASRVRILGAIHQRLLHAQPVQLRGHTHRSLHIAPRGRVNF